MIENTFLQRWNELSTAKQVLLDKRLSQHALMDSALDTVEPNTVIELVKASHRGTNRPEIRPVSREAYRRKRSEVFETSR